MWVLLVLGWHVSPGQGVAARGASLRVSAGATPRVYLFLSPECPLCQSYTRTLNQLEKQYAGKVMFYGIVPGKTWKKSDIDAFRARYKVGFSLQPDRELQIAHALHATTTPEAIVLAAGDSVVYEGAIDNWYRSLGRAGSRPTQFYLRDAIDAVLRHEKPAVRKTSPIGCLIDDF